MKKWLDDKEVHHLLGEHGPCVGLLFDKQVAQTITQLGSSEQKAVIDFLATIKAPKDCGKLSESKTRARTKLFRALGCEDPPDIIEINSKSYRLLEIYKHDSWAASAMYANENHKVVCKFNRIQPIWGIPMQWLGIRLAQRENKFLQLFADTLYVPTYSGEVKANGMVLPFVAAHDYVDGIPLRRFSQKVNDDFFPKLLNLLEKIHSRQISYMDLNKQENIIVTQDGNPCLIDFQICFHLSKKWPGNMALMQYLLRILQQSDRYHLFKHYTRLRPDLFSAEDLKIAQKRPWFINLYRCVQIPFRNLRRRLLSVLGFRNQAGQVTSEVFIEHGLREKDTRTREVIIANQRLHLIYHEEDQIEITLMTDPSTP